jgi:hypothetical protein
MTNSPSFWDDPEVKAAASLPTYARFENVGDTVVGTVLRIGRHKWSDGNFGIQIHFEEDDVPTVTASQVLLKQHLFALRPEPGDVLSIELTDIDVSNGKTLKRWRVERTRDGETVTEESA